MSNRRFSHILKIVVIVIQRARYLHPIEGAVNPVLRFYVAADS